MAKLNDPLSVKVLKRGKNDKQAEEELKKIIEDSKKRK